MLCNKSGVKDLSENDFKALVVHTQAAPWDL
jgi:hypothetical protein